MLDWLLGWLTQFVAWLFALVKGFVQAVVDILKDFVVWVFDQVFGAIAALLEAIPVPEFLSSGLQPLFAPLGPELGWFISVFGIGEALLIVGSGVAFRLTRKLMTLGQW